jgi:glutathione S-transferase
MSKAPQSPVVLYRCPTRTNVLCPCGAVERRLRKLKVEHRVARVPYKKGNRPEIVELTDQRRVPVLVDHDEVIADSKRILQYLDWKYGSEQEKPKKPERKPQKPERKPREPRRRRARRAQKSA